MSDTWFALKRQVDRKVSIVLVGVVGLSGCVESGQRDTAAPSASVWFDMVPVESIGSAVGLELAEVTAAAVGDIGQIVLIDGMAARLLRFHKHDGGHEVIGGSGDGPGEFRDPVGVVRMSDHRIAVLDRFHRRISLFVTDAGRSRLDGEVNLTFAPNAFCLIGTDYAVLGRLGQATIHIVDERGNMKESFVVVDSVGAAPEDRVGQMMVHEASEGFLACPNDSTVVHALVRKGIVNIISTTTGLVKRVIVEGFVEPVRSVRPGGVRFDIDPEAGFAHQVVAVLPICSNIVSVLVRESRAREDTREAGISAIDISLDERGTPPWTVGVPEVIAVSQFVAISRVREPVPGIIEWRRSPTSCSGSMGKPLTSENVK